MSYSAKVYSVFIASPSDVEIERRIVREVIYEWNTINSGNKSIVLLPLGWETHSVPDLAKPAQEVINEQILENADILVGIFWSKVGTPTKVYQSGTIEEIQEHINAGKPAMIYFSTAAISQNSDLAQWNKVKEFKDFCKSSGLYCEYRDVHDFEKLFRNHLSLKINKYPNILNVDNNYEDKISDNIIDSLYNAKKYLLLFHDVMNNAGQNEVNEISEKMTKTFGKIYIYKELNDTIMPDSHKKVFDEIIEKYNFYVSTVKSMIPLLKINKDSKEVYEIQNSINLQQRYLIKLCNSAWKLFED